MPPPHDLFKYRTADEVAECWEGVTSSLYKALWNDVVHTMSFAEVEDDGERNVLANFWDRLSNDHQVELNDLAIVEARDAHRL